MHLLGRKRQQSPLWKSLDLSAAPEHQTNVGRGFVIAPTPSDLTPTVAAYFNLTHPDKALRILALDEGEVSLNWNVAVGMVRPDKALRDAIDEIMARLRADGTVERIYRRYGVTLQSPK